jgi:uncharacterized protein involved in exopolysaccharide biosynthesis
VELVQENSVADVRRPGIWRRWKVFVGVLLVASAIGLILVYSRSPIFRASATVLTVKPKPVDTRSAEADLEHTTIQGRLLLGGELLGRLTRRLGEEGIKTGVEQLRNTLAVAAVPDTNLLELRAEGTEPEQLQHLVNTWGETYELYRAEEIEMASGRTIAEIKDQQQQLEKKISDARDELSEFRQANNIVGLDRADNTTMASLQGLNQSLSKARETLIDAQSRRATIDQANARGDSIIPNEQKRDIAKLRLEVERGRARLEGLEKKYTRVYIERDPDLEQLPAQVKEKELELANALKIANQMVREEADQAVESARQSVQRIERQIAEQNKKVELFNERYKEFKAMEDNLERLETLHTDNAERLAQIQTQNLAKFPPIQMVEWARVPTRPIYPDYDRDLMIALGSALGLALFVTWLLEYLSDKPGSRRQGPQFGVHIYTGDQSRALDAATANAQIADARVPPAKSLEPPAHRLPKLPRELTGAEVQTLLGAGSAEVGGYITLLMSGISPYELPMLHASNFDRDAGKVALGGATPRSFVLPPGVWQRIEAVLDQLDDAQGRLTLSELEQQLLHIAHDKRLDDPGTVNALALWHTYVLHLVRQGIDRDTLEARVGLIPPQVLDSLMEQAPPGEARAPERIDFTYPALAY